MPWRETAAELSRARAEIPVVFDSPCGRLVGVYTPPAPDAPPAGICAILLSRPRSHRNRMWVEGARRLATQGFSALRFDYHGDGDSQGTSLFHNPNQPDREDLLSALRFVRERFGDRQFLTLGMCFDARTALSVFADEPAAVRGMVFFAAPLMELDTLVRAHADHKDWKHMLHALTNRGNWTALGDPGRWRHMGTVLGRVLRRGSRAGGEAPNDTPLADTFVEHFRALVRARARALFVYGDRDAEYVSLQVALRTVFERLSPEERARFDVEVWPGDVHAFLNVPLQRRALERSLEWFGSFHPNAPSHERAGH